jgi:hypothetical protein
MKMYKIWHVGLATSLIVGICNAQEETLEKRQRIPSVKKAIGTVGETKEKEVSIVDKFKQMFSEGKVTGQIRAIYADYEQKKSGERDTYATALGGGLKYELASLYGFNGAVAFKTSQDLGFATGDREKQNPELSSSKGNYTELSEAYINYRYKDFNLRAGRQILDTPLADSDDIRMISNTFEAYIATYDFDNLSFMAGNIQKWQGFDAGLDDGWIDAGESGTNFGGISYAEKIVEFSIWYYNITKGANAIYSDLGVNYNFNKDFSIHAGVQYLNESELSSSGYEAEIYGGMVEFVAYDLGFNFAYNKANKKTAKQSFSGTGGGTMFTSMDTMIIDEITQDRDASAMVGGLSYGIGNFNMLYAYGDFTGDKNSAGEKAHIVEQDIGFEYNVNDEFVVAAIYVIEEDKESSDKTENDWNRAQIMVNYNF